MINFAPTYKQHLLFETFGKPEHLEICYGGAAGGGKSYGVWALMFLKAMQYPRIRIGYGRDTLVSIKKNSLPTFYKVMRDLNVPENFYKVNENKGQILFNNGSVILFLELSYMPSDPNYDRYGGLELTFGVIEEAAGVDNRGKQVMSSRLGRELNDFYNIPAHLYITTNPGTNFVYSDFYIPWVKGELAEHRLYIPAKVTENKYIGKNYASNLLKRLDASNATRLLKGLWDFDGDKARLIMYDNIQAIFIKEKIYNEGNKYITADIAYSGDKCVFLIWEGLTIIKIHQYKGEDTLNEKTGKPIYMPEFEFVRLCEQYKIKQEYMAYDADGVGHHLKGKFPRAQEIVNISKPINDENFNHLKSQLNFKLAELINNGDIKVLESAFYGLDSNFKDEMIQELYEIKSKPLESTEGKLSVIKKDAVKKIIGRSPDIADAMTFRMIFELNGIYQRPFYLGK